MKSKLSTPKSPNQIRVTIGLVRYILRSLLRNRAGIFFGLFFPLILVFIFGALSSSTPKTKIGVADSVPDSQAVYQVLQKIANGSDAPIELKRASEQSLRTLLGSDKLDGLILPDLTQPTAVTLVGSNSNPQGQATVQNILDGVSNQLNLQAAHAPQVFTYKLEEVSGKKFRTIDFILPGQIGFSLLSIATFGIAFPFLTLRKTLVLKRMLATAVKPISFVVAECFARSIQGMIQTVIIIGAGVITYHFTLAHGWVTILAMLAISFVGVLGFLGFGIFFANIVKDEQTLPIVINLFNLPQLMLCGVFFPTDSLAPWLQKIGNNLPLSYLNDAMRKVAVEGAHFSDIWLYFVGLAAWGIVAYILAARTFRTE